VFPRRHYDRAKGQGGGRGDKHTIYDQGGVSRSKEIYTKFSSKALFWMDGMNEIPWKEREFTMPFFYYYKHCYCYCYCYFYFLALLFHFVAWDAWSGMGFGLVWSG
jgi:hypothetical protein